MKIMTRYLLRQLSLATFLITCILAGAIWLTQSLRFIEAFITHGISLGTFFKLLLYILPDLVGIILPISLLIATLFVYNRFYMDHELTTWRAAGADNRLLARPAFLLSFGAMVLLYGINLYLLPVSFQKFRDLEFEIRNSISGYMVQPGIFNNFKDVTVYVRSRKKNGELKGIFIQDNRQNAQNFTLLAEEGRLLESPEGLKVTLKNGHRQELNLRTGAPSTLSFDQYTIALSTHTQNPKKRAKKPYEYFLGDLLNPDLDKNDPSSVKRFQVEAHQRLVMPLTALVFTLVGLGVFLQGQHNRRSRFRRLIVVTSLCSGIEVLTLGLLNLGERFPISFVFVYLFLLLTGIGALKLLVRDKPLKFGN